jgi:hypothetical protein
MLLSDTATGEKIEAVIELMTEADFKVVKKSKDRFDKFDWNKYKKEEVYKIRLKTEEKILGIMCITDHTDQETDAIEIELLEASVENIGKHKEFDHIGGCLIAYACREAFKRGHDGVVFLTPKSYLVDHYPKQYGFQHVAMTSPKRPVGFMVLYEKGSRHLINKYLD